VPDKLPAKSLQFPAPENGFELFWAKVADFAALKQKFPADFPAHGKSAHGAPSCGVSLKPLSATGKN
jgi:hypothetical protein